MLTDTYVNESLNHELIRVLETNRKLLDEQLTNLIQELGAFLEHNSYCFTASDKGRLLIAL